jgi:two-component system sensor histidine kinase KdpD
VPDGRPTPESMLERAAAEADGQRRGRLRIFFGMAPGVGKTCALLQSAQEKRRAGLDVVLGWVETHGRRETEALTAGLERLPPRRVDYRGLELTEFDLDAALRRRPALLLIDELAHRNAAGSRHARRWQDVEELLDAGIDVHTTLNVQHVESLNDVVATITGVVVRETVPDSIVDRASEIELVDLPPDELLQRLREGKVYLPVQAEQARQRFFVKGNLLALRELALRKVAERVDAQGLEWRRQQGVSEPWGTRERVLVAVGPAPSSADVIRSAYRLATRLRAPWLAVSVETPAYDRLSAEARERVAANLALAQRLGAEIVVLRGEHLAEELTALARERSVTKILVGKSRPGRWPGVWPGVWPRPRGGGLVEALVRGSGAADVLVTSGEQGAEEPARPRPAERPDRRGYLWAALPVAGSTGLCWLAGPLLSSTDQAMVYLLGVLAAASRLPRGPALCAAVLSVAAFDFCFVPPAFTFAVDDQRYLITFLVMLGVGLLVSSLTVRLRAQADAARERERHTAALLAMSAQFVIETGVAEIARMAAGHVRELLGVEAIVLLADRAGNLTPCGGAQFELARTEQELAVARWAFQHGRLAGHGTDTLPGAEALFIPLVGSGGHLGAFGVALARRPNPLAPSQWRLLEAFVAQTALALERALLVERSATERVAAETERTRSALLSAVSHDLRTPLASIAGAASLLRAEPDLEPQVRAELLATVHEEADRLSRLVADLLDLTRLESGDLRVQKEPYPLEEIVDSALARRASELRGRAVERRVPEEVLVAPVDPLLLEQVLLNLLENAAKYTPPGSPLEVSVERRGEQAVLEVADRGPGLPPGAEARVFERFYRAADSHRSRGTGLGLTVSEAIVRAHHGRIEAENRPGGGALFRVSLPLADDGAESAAGGRTP